MQLARFLNSVFKKDGFILENAYFKNYSGIHSLGTNYSEKNGNAIFWEKKYDMKERCALKWTRKNGEAQWYGQASLL